MRARLPLPALCFLLCTTHLIAQNEHGPDRVTLPESHTGTLEVDTRLMDSYGAPAENKRQFYLASREVFAADPDADFTDARIVGAARDNDLPLMGGPMLGRLKEDRVVLWLRPGHAGKIRVILKDDRGRKAGSFGKYPAEPGVEQRIVLDGLLADRYYEYTVYGRCRRIAEGSFRTAPASGQKGMFRLVFGSCFHKIGLHNTALVEQILAREPHAMMLLGDLAVDDRENNIAMHRSDYILRDVSPAWTRLAARVPIHTAWDDHDYLNNDLSGIPEGFTPADRKALREVWEENWINPPPGGEGIYFRSRVGPVEIIMLDTRSCRTVEKRMQYGSYLGAEQMDWLKETLSISDAPFKVISSGTMWSDYISKGKDSWGTWDPEARREIFDLIESEKIPGVVLLSGDRHGARGFALPLPSGHTLYEFEAASLGGVPGPEAIAADSRNQLFGYAGEDLRAFGELTFDTTGDLPNLTFRLIDESGTILEEILLEYSKMMPDQQTGK